MPSRRRWLLAFVTTPFVAYLVAWGVLMLVDRFMTTVNPGGVVPHPRVTEPHFDAFMTGYVILVGSILSYLPGVIFGIPFVWLLERTGLNASIHYAGAGVAVALILAGLVFALAAARWPGETIPVYALAVFSPAALAYGVSGMLMTRWVAHGLGGPESK